MTEHSWDLKSNYMLAFTLCKYGVSPQRWDLVASDLANYINATPESCQAQFDRLCQQYGSDWRKQSAEPLHIHVFTTMKRLYYADLYDRMTESRDLLMVMYDFIRLFKTGRINSNDVNEILQDIKKTAATEDNAHDSEREQKIKMLGRLKGHMMKRNPQAVDPQYSSFPVELLPPPPFFQTQPPEPIISTVNENDRQVPSMDTFPKPNAVSFSSYPIIVHSNNLLIDNERQPIANNQSNDANIDEIELSSDDDVQDRTPTTSMPNFDEPTSASNLTHDQTESTSIADELVQISQSASALPLPTDVSNSHDGDAYEQASDPSLSSQPTSDTHSSSRGQATTSEPSERSNVHLNGISIVASDQGISDNDRIDYQQPTASEPFTTFSRLTLVEDDEVARMDGEPSPINTNGAVAPNNRADPVTEEQSITSSVTTHSEAPKQEDSATPKSVRRQSRLPNNSTANNYRKSVSSILNSLKTAKYGYDFAKSLKSFKLPSEYYDRIKNPLDIPEIRERMNNGDYDDNILLFERDVLLMFTNALYAYQRDMDIHAQARCMIDYAMELFTAIDEAHTPWKNGVDGKLSGVFRHNNDENSLSIGSSIGSDSSTKHFRRQATSNHPTPKRQRKTTH